MQFAPPPPIKVARLPLESEREEQKNENRENVSQNDKQENGSNVIPNAKSAYGGIKEDAKYNMQDEKITAYFPWEDRLRNAMRRICCSCFSSAFTSKTEEMKAMKPMNRFPKEKHENKLAKLTINCTGLLELDDKVIHPFVKVHIIDASTGKYLAKMNPSQNSVTYKESAAVMSYNEQGCASKEIELDFIPPFATRYCDFRILGENRAEFYESFTINESLESLYSDNTIILFEILDYNPTLILEDSPLLRSNMYPVAWAYLRPLGESLVHSSTKRLQLYRYKFNPTTEFSKQYVTDIRTPLVYFDFNWPIHTEYPSFLEIDISYVRSAPRIIVTRPPLLPYEEEIGTRFIESSPRKTADKDKGGLNGDGDKEPEKIDAKLREKLISWERGFGQPCLIPNKLIYRYESDDKGCFAVKFSNKGKYLAAGCSESDKKSLIKMFNVETGNFVGIIGQHQGVIHEFKWSITDDLMLSMSNDSIVKLWICNDLENNIGNAGDYTENEKKLLLGTLQHPSYVYSAEFLPEYANKLRGSPVIATACFDGKVRIWVVNIDEETGKKMQAFCAAEFTVDQPEQDLSEATHYLLSHSYPTSLVFDDTGRLYVGDSNGLVHVWDVIVFLRGIIKNRHDKKKLLLHQLKL